MKQTYEFGSVYVNLVAKTEEFEKQIEQAKKTLKALDSVSNGRGLENYFLEQEELVRKLTEAYREYIYWQDKDSAEELIKSAHAIQAMTGDLSSIKHIDGLGDISKELSEVEKKFRDTSDLFSADKFRDVFEAIYTVRSAGLDVNEVFEKFKNQDVETLTSKISELSTELENARDRIKDLEAENSRLEDGTAVEMYKAKVEELNTKLSALKHNAESAFRGFLVSHGLNPYDDGFSKYFTAIRENGKSALQVMSQFRQENQHLFDNAEGGDALVSMLQVIQSTVDQLEEGVKALTSTLNDMYINGVKSVSNIGTGSMHELASALLEVNDATKGGGGGNNNTDWLQALIEKLTEFAGIDANNLGKVATSLSSIASMNGLSVTKAPITNISTLLESLKTFAGSGRTITLPDFSKLNGLEVNAEHLKTLATYLPKIADHDYSTLKSLPDLSKLNGLEVNADQLKTLATYLPKIATGDYTGLHVLDGITFENLKNLSLENSIASIKAIASLTRALNGSDLSGANAFLTGLDFSKIQNVGVDEKLGGFAAALAQLAKIPYEPLSQILSLSFQNLNSIDIKDSAAQSIESLAGSLTTLSVAREELVQIVEFIKEYQTLNLGGGGKPPLSEDLANINGGADKVVTTFETMGETVKGITKQVETLTQKTEGYVRTTERIKTPNPDKDGQLEQTSVRVTEDYAAAAKESERKAEAARKEADSYTKLIIQLDAYIASLRQSVQASKDAGVADDESVDKLNGIIASLATLENKLKAKPTGKFKDLSAEFLNAKESAESLRREVDNVTDAQNKVNKVADAFVTLDTNIGKYIARQKEYINAAKKAGLENDENVQTLKTMVSCLEALQNGIRNLDYYDVKEATSEFHNLQNATEEAARSVKEVTKISVESTAEDAETKAETLKAVARYEAIRKQIINDINKSSKAEHGTRAADYKSLIDYRDNVEKLFKDFEDHKITLEQFKDGLENTGIGAASAANNIRAAGEMTETFSDKIKKNIKNLSAYFSVSRMFTLVIRYMRDLIQTSIELDKEMGQLRIVTDETEDSYASFSSSIAKTAKEISASMTDLISATTTFARLGYSLDESSVLAKYTAMLQQVGDIDASAAQDAVTAITKAFADEVDINNIESVMDRLVVVGRNIAHVCSDAYLVIGYNGQSRFGMIA